MAFFFVFVFASMITILTYAKKESVLEIFCHNQASGVTVTLGSKTPPPSGLMEQTKSTVEGTPGETTRDTGADGYQGDDLVETFKSNSPQDYYYISYKLPTFQKGNLRHITSDLHKESVGHNRTSIGVNLEAKHENALGSAYEHKTDHQDSNITTLDDSDFEETYVRQFLLPNFSRGRLGNIMFIYASCYSIALQNNRSLLLSSRDQIYHPFVKISVHPAPPRQRRQCMRKLVKVTESKPRAFEQFDLHDTNASCIQIDGFLQSWKYFKDEFDDIRNQFTWRTSIKEKAIRNIEILKHRTWPDRSSKVTTVGIHVRRGDYVREHRPLADREYYEIAKQYFLTRFSNVLFIVTTSPNIEDWRWCLDNIQNGSGVTVLSSSKDPYVDMALLSLTDHLIISTGTFGWWAGFLNKGTVLHFDWIPVNHRKMTRDDYILPYWVGIKAVIINQNDTSVFRTIT
ncbi:galactoside alpha-(1,2)-fucosyltransferase 1-like [Argopecten irradians]|uniref:galactoside alpha-(1,2)-fucosyltransferase 1-like n=1 Tax=Argopecten irradians TaxID=31199 RepID=UPI00371DDB04